MRINNTCNLQNNLIFIGLISSYIPLIYIDHPFLISHHFPKRKIFFFNLQNKPNLKKKKRNSNFAFMIPKIKKYFDSLDCRNLYFQNK